MSGLACVAVLFATSLTGSASSREGMTEEVVHDAGEQLHALLAMADAASDGPDALPSGAPDRVAPRVLLYATAPVRSPVRVPPRAHWRAHSAARGPPARA